MHLAEPVPPATSTKVEVDQKCRSTSSPSCWISSTAGCPSYERLVAAAAGYVAEDGGPVGDHPSVSRLTEASDFLHGVAAGLAEFRAGTGPARAAS